MINWFEQEKYSQNKQEESKIFKFGNFFSDINSNKLYQQLERIKQVHQQQQQQQQQNEILNDNQISSIQESQKYSELFPNESQSNDIQQESSINNQQSEQIEDAQQMNQYFEILSQIPIMKDLTEEQLIEVSARLQSVEFEQGESIIVQGDSMLNFYIVLYGTAGALGPIDPLDNLEEDQKFDENHKFVEEYESHDFFGQIGLLVSENDQPTVVAKTTIKLLVLNSEDFLELLAPIHNYLLNPQMEIQD